jgi:hypothetical protein
MEWVRAVGDRSTGDTRAPRISPEETHPLAGEHRQLLVLDDCPAHLELPEHPRRLEGPEHSLRGDEELRACLHHGSEDELKAGGRARGGRGRRGRRAFAGGHDCSRCDAERLRGPSPEPARRRLDLQSGDASQADGEVQTGLLVALPGEAEVRERELAARDGRPIVRLGVLDAAQRVDDVLALAELQPTARTGKGERGVAEGEGETGSKGREK